MVGFKLWGMKHDKKETTPTKLRWMNPLNWHKEWKALKIRLPVTKWLKNNRMNNLKTSGCWWKINIISFLASQLHHRPQNKTNHEMLVKEVHYKKKHRRPQSRDTSQNKIKLYSTYKRYLPQQKLVLCHTRPSWNCYNKIISS